MRITSQQRQSRSGVTSTHDPGVTALVGLGERRSRLPVRAGFEQGGGGIRQCGSVGIGDNIGTRIIGQEGDGFFPRSSGDKFCDNQLILIIIAQSPSHQFAKDQRVNRRPFLRRDSEDLEFQRKFIARLREISIDAVRVGLQGRLRISVESLPIGFGGFGHAEDAHEGIVFQSALTDDFAECSVRGAALGFHRPKSVLRGDESLRVKQVMRVFGDNVRNSAGIAVNGDGRC